MYGHASRYKGYKTISYYIITGFFSFMYQTADFKDKDSRLKSNLAEKLPKDPYW